VLLNIEADRTLLHSPLSMIVGNLEEWEQTFELEQVETVGSLHMFVQGEFFGLGFDNI